jgi:hypothetical protein
MMKSPQCCSFGISKSERGVLTSTYSNKLHLPKIQNSSQASLYCWIYTKAAFPTPQTLTIICNIDPINYALTASAWATNRALHPLQTSSKPPTTSPQTPAHSLAPNLSDQFPRFSHLSPSSRSSSSLRISATSSRALFKRRVAVVVVCRDI